jgi:hypothetical protein
MWLGNTTRARRIRRGDAPASQPCIDAELAGAERGYLKQATGDHQILHEVNHLVLIGEVRIERKAGRYCEYRHGNRRKPGFNPQ